MGHIAIEALRCKGCERCIVACPKDLISISDRLNERGYHYVVFDGTEEDCSGCTLCAIACPDQGIEVWKNKDRQNFGNTTGLTERMTHYCPGCTHGVVHRIAAEVLTELGVVGRTIGIAPVGCSVLAYEYFNFDMFEAAHGRAPAVATGAKRARPDSIVFAYQGDGDLASIGTNEIIHAANRGEKITVIFINNAIYGMTGGQMAPTTMAGQRTTTSPLGRDVEETGHPMRVSELLATLGTPAYIARGSSHDAKHSVRLKTMIKKAFQHQIEGRCFSLVEVLSTCPTNWGLSPNESSAWVANEMMAYYPLGVIKEPPRATAPVGELIEEQGDDVQGTEVLMAGFGGQGMLLAGKVLAHAAMEEGLQVSWLPSYGPEMRGGTANVTVCVSPQPIGSPLITTPKGLLVMNLPSLEKFAPKVAPGGVIIVNASLVSKDPERPDCTTLAVDARKLADDAGTVRAANFVMLGAYVGLSDVVPVGAVEREIEREMAAKPQFIDANVAAFRAGVEQGQSARVAT